jgi:tyrosyl-tRNA synthetase
MHLGHTVVINKMRHFQQLGHRVAVPHRRFHRDDRRPDRQEGRRGRRCRAKRSKQNAETYQEQVFKILDPEKTEVRSTPNGWARSARRA